MRESNPSLPSISRNSSYFSEDILTIFAEQKTFFSALYEYSQCAPPQIIWQIGSPAPAENDAFMNYVANTPMGIGSDPWSAQPSFLVSQFNSLHFIAMYVQIYDSEARGFVRTLIYVLANPSKDIINSTYFEQKSQIIQLCKDLQNESEKIFVLELQDYAASFQKLISKEPEKGLVSKMNELKPILKRFSIDSDQLGFENAEDHPPEYFTSIRNNLRSIAEITKLDAYKFEEFTLGLPTTPILSTIAAEAHYNQPKPSIIFTGAFKNYSDFVIKVFSHNYDSSPFRLIDLVPRKAFYYCAFTVLSGHTLVIQHPDPEKVMSLAERFSIISPFCNPSFIGVFKKAKPIQCLRYAICVVQELENEQKPLVSLLDLGRQVYSGDGCPPHSFVSTLGKWGESTETAFILNLHSTIHRYATNFIAKLAEISAKGPLAKDKLMAALKEIGFTKDDKPIIKYWLHCYFNKQHLRPVLMNNMSRGGLTMITL